MRFKSFVSMGIAAVLIVPTLITAANPELAYAKTSKTSSKKISAKAKSVIAKIKAINPKKSDYIAKTKSAVSAYKKLSSKDKKMVYNYGTLKKHWSKIQPSLKKITYLNKKVATLNSKNYATKIATLKKQYDGLNRITKAAVPKATVKKLNYYANRKASLVVAQIKAINPKKSDYVVKTKSALSAYNKLSKTDKKKVTNYSTLKKHWTNIQPYLKKVDSFSKSVATLNTKNFTAKSVTLEKQYNNLDDITKAAVPSTTLKKLNYYSDVVGTKNLVFKTLTNDPTTPSTTEDGTKILTVINAYKKLSGAQQVLLKDLLTINASDSADEKSKKQQAINNLKRYLALENLIKKAADIEKKYAALQPISKAKPQSLVALYNNYEDVKGDSIDYKYKDESDNDKETRYAVSNFVPDGGEIDKIAIAYSDQITKAKDFTAKVEALPSGSKSDDYLNVLDVVDIHKTIQGKTNAAIGNYLPVAPIDLVDKNTITTYNKFAPIPDLVLNLKGLKTFPTKPGSLDSNDVSDTATLLTQYNKLGADQKIIVQNALDITTNNAKNYLSEAKNISSAQAIDKSYASAIKNKAKSSYFADLKKVYDAYTTATLDVQLFVVNASNIIKITDVGSAYNNALAEADALQKAIEALNENSKLADINAVIGKYKILSNQVPTPISLVDASALKTYNQFAAIPDVVKSVNKIPNKAEPTEGNGYGFKKNNINDILLAIKPYRKLGSTQQVIVDKETANHAPSISSLAGDESSIKEAQKIDSAYLKLKKSSSNYPKDAKKVFYSYDDASSDVKKYVVNTGKITGLLTVIKDSQDIADTFEEKVKLLSKKSTIADVESAVDYYNKFISTNPKVSSLVDKNVMKKYNEYAPVSNVVKLLNLIKESNVDSPSVTPTDLYYIQKATIAYNALKPDPKIIIDDAERKKFPFLYDGKYIKEAAAIDKAYEKVKPTDAKYELEILDVYYKMYDRAPAVVKKYVINKAELDKIGTRYEPQLTIAKEFETKVINLSHISGSGYTPTIKTVRNIEQYYIDNIKYNKISAKYNIPLSTLIDPEIMEEYRKYSLVLQIQDIAKTIYVLYGKLFNDENVEFDKVKDSYYCNDAPSKDPSRCHPISYYENSKKGFTDSGKKSGNPIKITNPNDIKLIYKAIDYFQQLDTPQIAILKKAPSSLTDTYYKDRFGGNSEPNTEAGNVHPSIPMSDGEIKNFLKAQEIDKEYEALKPSSKTYINDAIVLYYKFYKAGTPVQLYVIHDKEIRAFENSYKMGEIIAGVDNFVKAVNLLSNASSIDDIKNGKSGKDGGVVDQYNNLNEAQIAIIDQGVLTKYNAYAPIAEIMSLTPDSGKTYSETNINNMLKAISIYKKLAKDPKSIVTAKIKSDLSYKYLSHESEIKAAQKVDKAFKKLDKSDDKYVTNLKKVAKEFEALKYLELSGLPNETAKKYVTTASEINAAIDKNVYKTPNEAAKAFENLIQGETENDKNALINKYPLKYSDIDLVVNVDSNAYNKLSSKAKSLVDSGVMKIYNKYAPVVDVVKTLDGITPPTESQLITWASNIEDPNKNDFDSAITGTGYYQTIYSKRDIGTEISNAIQLFNKLGSDQKEIVKKELDDAHEVLLDETNNIKAAQSLDKKIAAIKPNSTSYVKGIIDAQKTLNLLPPKQRVYLLNSNKLKDFSITKQMDKASKNLSEFEKGVNQVDEWTSEIEKDENGDIIPGTCTDTVTSTTHDCNTLITEKMGILKNQFEQLNTPRLVNGSEIKLASLIDRKILARYQYFRAIYDVIDELK